MCEKCGYVEPDDPALVAVADVMHSISRQHTFGLITRQEYIDRTALAVMEYICDQQAKAA